MSAKAVPVIPGSEGLASMRWTHGVLVVKAVCPNAVDKSEYLRKGRRSCRNKMIKMLEKSHKIREYTHRVGARLSPDIELEHI
jgi:hypothetical protein